jgi:hypothetical protein
MPCAKPLALIAACLTTACATSTPPLPQPMARLQKPSECLTSCPALPLLTETDDVAVVLWTHELIDLAGTCRRMHETCRTARSH